MNDPNGVNAKILVPFNLRPKTDFKHFVSYQLLLYTVDMRQNAQVVIFPVHYSLQMKYMLTIQTINDNYFDFTLDFNLSYDIYDRSNVLFTAMKFINSKTTVRLDSYKDLVLYYFDDIGFKIYYLRWIDRIDNKNEFHKVFFKYSNIHLVLEVESEYISIPWSKIRKIYKSELSTLSPNEFNTHRELRRHSRSNYYSSYVTLEFNDGNNELLKYRFASPFASKDVKTLTRVWKSHI